MKRLDILKFDLRQCEHDCGEPFRYIYVGSAEGPLEFPRVLPWTLSEVGRGRGFLVLRASRYFDLWL